MTDLRVITSDAHGNRRWQRNTNYAFAAQDMVVAIGTHEIGKALMAAALAFIATEQGHLMVMIQGLSSGQNLFVTPDGRWVGDYIPAAYRAYPFRLGKGGKDELVLCIDEASGCITDEHAGELFFTKDNKPSDAVTDIYRQLTRIEREREHMLKAGAILAKYELLEDWPLNVLDAGETKTVLNGLRRINETRLHQVGAEALLELRNSGALMLAYCQLISMQNIHKLGSLSGRQAALAAGTIKLNDDGVISFDNLR